MPPLVRRSSTRRVQAHYDRMSSFQPYVFLIAFITVALASQYSYLASVPLLVVYSVATTVIKFQEGKRKPHCPVTLTLTDLQGSSCCPITRVSPPATVCVWP